METEKQVIGVIESVCILVKKQDFQKNRFIFPNVCDCVALSIKLKNGDMFLYHMLRADSKRSIEKELSKLKDIESCNIIGGNITSFCHPDENDTIYNENGIKYSIRDIQSFENKSSKYPLAKRDIDFTIDSKIKQEEIYNNSSTYSKLRAYYKNFHFEPKYKNLCGPANMTRIKEVLSNLKIDFNTMSCPNNSTIEVDSNNNFSLIDKEIEYKTFTHIRENLTETGSGRHIIRGVMIKDNPYTIEKNKNGCFRRDVSCECIII
jgi:hypothetical protein